MTNFIFVVVLVSVISAILAVVVTVRFMGKTANAATISDLNARICQLQDEAAASSSKKVSEAVSVVDNVLTEVSDVAVANGGKKITRKLGMEKTVERNGKTIIKVCVERNGKLVWRTKKQDAAVEVTPTVSAVTVEEPKATVVETKTDEVAPKATRTKTTRMVGDTIEVIRKGKKVVKIWVEKADGTFGWRRKSAVDKENGLVVEKPQPKKAEVIEQPKAFEESQVETTKKPKDVAIDSIIANMKGKQVAAVKSGIKTKIGKNTVEVVKVENFADGLMVVVKNEGGVEKSYKASYVGFSTEFLNEVANGVLKKADETKEKKTGKGSSKKGATKTDAEKLTEAQEKVNTKKEQLKNEVANNGSVYETNRVMTGILKTMLNKKIKSVTVDLELGDTVINSVDARESGLAINVTEQGSKKDKSLDWMVRNNKINIETLKTIARLVNECAA